MPSSLVNLTKSVLPALVICLFFVTEIKAQQSEGCVFLQGNYLEIGIAPNGAFGTPANAPAGYHPRPIPLLSNLYNPVTTTYAQRFNAIGFVADYGKDGWTVGSPPFFGDYFMPGTVQEGFSLQINGVRSNAWSNNYQTNGSSGFSGPLTGSNTSLTVSATEKKALWEGTMNSLLVRQTITLKNAKSYFTANIFLKNTGIDTLKQMYYMRTVDPDNEVSYTNNFTTKNKIAYQLPNTFNKTLVTASGLQYQNSYLGLGTKDCQARCFILPSGLFPLADLVSIYDGSSGYIYADSSIRDAGIGVIFKIGSLAPGDSTTFSYAYILNENDLDEAFTQTEPGFSYNGTYYPSGGVITQPTGTVLPVDIVNGDYYNWTWAPPIFLDVTTGTHVNATVSTGPVTYTVTGVSSGSISTLCSNKSLNITISPFSVSPPPTVISPVVYCLHSAASALTATGSGIIRWYTTATGGVGSLIAPIPSTSSTGTTTWYVTQEISGTESIRIPVIVNVMPLPTVIITPASATICQGDFIQLTATGSASYAWNASGTLNTTVGPIVIAGPMSTTTYVVTGTDANSCQKADSVTVIANPLPKPDLGADKSICDQPATILSPGNFKNYLWHDNSTQPGYPVNKIGAYWVKVENNFGCTASDTINIISFFANPENFLPANTSFCRGNQHVINVPGYAQYLWDDGSIFPSIAVKRFGQITLTVKDNNGCNGTDSMTLFDAKCIPYAIPNAFTPNNDGKNDVFRPYLTQIITNYKMTIWNRWGEIVFTSAEPQKGWDGFNKGKEQPSGTYVYTISFTDSDRLPVNLNGTVNIIR